MAIELSEKQITEGWQIVKFGEIAKNISERVEPAETDLEVYVGLEHLDPQSLRITRRGVPADVKGQKLRVRPGQIIFGKRRAYQKKVAVADFDGICSAHAMVLEEVVGKIIPGLLPFFMQSDMFMDRAVAISEGSLSPTIKWKKLAIQEFPLPPIERQKEILEVLEKVEEVYGFYVSAINRHDRLTEVVINQIISGGDYNAIKKAIRLGTKTVGAKIRIEHANDFCSSIADGTHESPKPSKNGYPLITSKNLKQDGLDLSDTYLISEEDYISICKRSWVKAGDILFAMIGTIGNPVILKPGEDTIATKNVGIFRFDCDIKKSMWFLLFLKSTLGKRQIDNETSGSTQKYFALNKLRELKVPVPENKDEIEKAVSVYNNLSEQLVSLKKAHTKICNISRLVKKELLLGEVSNELQ